MISRMLRCGVVLGGVLAAVSCGDNLMLNDDGEAVKAVIEAHVAPSASCKLDSKGEVIARGRYDVGQAQDARGYCAKGYELNLRVHNLDAESVVFTSATVALENAAGDQIVFQRGGRDELPNPFESKTASPVPGTETGIVTVLAIPVSYAAQLGLTFGDQEVDATVVLHGETESGRLVASRPFTFPIQLCVGCMHRCLRDVLAADLDPMTLYGDSCADDSGADDRVCIDPDC